MPRSVEEALNLINERLKRINNPSGTRSEFTTFQLTFDVLEIVEFASISGTYTGYAWTYGTAPNTHTLYWGEGFWT